MFKCEDAESVDKSTSTQEKPIRNVCVRVSHINMLWDIKIYAFQIVAMNCRR